MRNPNTMIGALLVLVAMTVAMPAMAATYDIDASHSSVEFKIKHLGISSVRGTFTSFSGQFDFVRGNPEQWSSEATIDVASVSTGNEKRDGHLKNADFFDIENHPNMVFSLTRVEMEDDEEGKIFGDLTMQGKTLPVVLNLEINGEIVDPWGNDRAGFSATGKINREDWGLTYGKVLESGGLLIGKEVKIYLEIEGVKRKKNDG